jgi:2-polyprenyl-3-methyl-5-hydroxy-6-metoxy-1,4-benzoquinol methylase
MCNKIEKNYIFLAGQVRDATDLKVIQCLSCGHVQITPIPPQEEEQEYYDRDGQVQSICPDMELNDKWQKAKSDVDYRYKLISSHCATSGRILDIGAGYGFLLNKLGENGYRCDGIEISSSRREVAQRLFPGNMFVHNILYDDLTELHGEYDLVTAFQVLEHIPSPGLFLARIRDLLTPGGKIILEVPNVDDHALTLSRAYRDFFWQRAHLSYFSTRSLKQVIELAGFINYNLTGRQRYSVLNLGNWILNGKPQLAMPSYGSPEGLGWLDESYRSYLCERLICDTLVAVINT